MNTWLITTQLQERRRDIAQEHGRGASGYETCSALSSAVDQTIRSAFEIVDPVLRPTIAVIALGGYGRRELCPCSDVDVMVLCRSGAERSAAAAAATSFLHVLWDAGLDVGHSVRTVEEVMTLHGDTLDAWVSVLESRFVCGNHDLATELYRRIGDKALRGMDQWLSEGILADLQARHERYGNSVKLLEPNIKKSSGGLRDIHAVFWLHQSRWRGQTDEDGPTVQSFLVTLASEGVLDQDSARAARDAVEFLLRVRHEMHYQRGALHDTLEYALQQSVAEALGYGGTDRLRSVEIFMREYYLHARDVHALCQDLVHQLRDDLDAGHPVLRAGSEPGSLFVLQDGMLALRSSTARLESAEQVFEAFALAAEHEAELGLRLRAAIGRSVGLVQTADPSSGVHAQLFRRVLGSRHVAETLRSMNDLDILGAYLPEFGQLVAFFQHNVYHYFTADEHTLVALARAEQLRDVQGVLHDVYRNLRRKEILYLAILLHDIAKPRGVADHEITGVEISRDILRRLGMEDAVPLVAFLVRHHLVMEQVAFRRNIHDPETIREFGARFDQPEQLDYLYVLTYADLAAVNPNVWTEWKATLLQELYQLTAEVLRRDLRGHAIAEYHAARQEAAAGRVVDLLSVSLPREEVERHLAAMQNDSYVSVFTEEEIREHIRRSALREPVSTIVRHAEGYSELTVISADAPFALSKFCAVLAANDANIFDANIFTRRDGVIIDRFRVTDAASKQRLHQHVCEKIAGDLALLVGGNLDIERLFLEHHRRWRRRPKAPVNPNTRTDVRFENSPNYTIIDVFAPDAVGFLYRVTETISRTGLDIWFAKIATRVDGIVDTFYVLDRSGKPLVDEGRRSAVRGEILETIKAMAEQELA